VWRRSWKGSRGLPGGEAGAIDDFEEPVAADDVGGHGPSVRAGKDVFVERIQLLHERAGGLRRAAGTALPKKRGCSSCVIQTCGWPPDRRILHSWLVGGRCYSRSLSAPRGLSGSSTTGDIGHATARSPCPWPIRRANGSGDCSFANRLVAERCAAGLDGSTVRCVWRRLGGGARLRRRSFDLPIRGGR